eukprot:TRINITY_DN46409_c0_g1_i1.p1 TRINITY_DN46409_c0_g1~~TRINITY_DN46409_c0_g1_i1.p1  ORF type:complete len:359 (-),score=84.42 TRINITY_DN46409_c0_g1_i1:154-1230(-)
MGHKESKLPPLQDEDRLLLASYNLESRHLAALFKTFCEVDVNLNGVWTVNEVYTLIREQRLSMRAPIIDRVFFMGDGTGDGVMEFQDFLIAFTSFCALTKEEILQLLFIIMDVDRSGTIEKEELLEFFSYVPPGYDAVKEPLFPVNNKNALDKFRGGTWLSLEFDGLAQLCEHFPYISYPAYHVQELFRQKLLGISFWERLERQRMVASGLRKPTRKIRMPNNDVVYVSAPGRCTMQQFLEFSRRRTKVSNGRRVVADVEATSSANKAKDEEISRSPLSSMIRNPKCMYHVPRMVSAKVTDEMRAANTVELQMEDSYAGAGSPTVAAEDGGGTQAAVEASDQSSSEEEDETDDDEDAD